MALRCTLRLIGKAGALSLPIGKARRIRSANNVFLRTFGYSLRFAC
jgi:hypothetical protein